MILTSRNRLGNTERKQPLTKRKQPLTKRKQPLTKSLTKKIDLDSAAFGEVVARLRNHVVLRG
jgi:hypothetical protein